MATKNPDDLSGDGNQRRNISADVHQAAGATLRSAGLSHLQSFV
jgi:hypothetical protein